MARYRDPVCRLCRREGVKLFLKGERCYSDKCALERRNYPPGQHGQARKKQTEYAKQLREKQKLKRIYGLLEGQFKRYFALAERSREITGDRLLQILEQRLDNLVYRLGFARSRAEARQLVRHGHFLVDGRRVDIPSYLVKPGQSISVREKSRQILAVQQALETAKRRGVPDWLELDESNFVGRLKSLPTREEISVPVNEKLVVELYSK
ncbi:MAG: 30S ribosomal protein S4 [Candidatus Binatia bacterium]|nr:MAG: 30S ribosomal protein S4 [Candidatus Binatia bacterium]